MTGVKKNQNYKIQITGMNHEGQGVGRIDGFTVFVDGLLKDESAEIKIIKVGKSYGVGKIVKILSPSPERSQPFCSSYKRCGGCSLQHMSYAAQLKFKADLVRESIKRIGKIEDVPVHDTLGMSSGLNYRNKAQFPVGVIDGKPAIGFYAVRSHDIIDNESCGIQHEAGDRVRAIVKEFISENKITIYNEADGKGLIRHVIVRTGFKTGELMVVIVINGKSLPHKERLVQILLEGFKPESSAWTVKSVYLNVNVKNTNVILGQESIKIYGEDTITDYIGKYRFNISPLSFYQVNPLQTEVLYGKALEYAGLTGRETVFDLYCGIGTISLFLSEKADKVYGVEVVEEAIEDARRNAVLNNVTNAEFIAGEAEVVIPEMYKQGIRADVVVVDPPRKGCDEVLLKTLVDMQPHRIVYVSCNPATLARDLKYLSENGYRAVEVQPLDMFPQTAHCEAVVLLQNEKR